MDEFVYNALGSYYNALNKTGHMPYADAKKLLVLIFYRDFVFNDYRGILSRDDYRLIERALDCLYGTSCLIPYPDYLKMGKLHLGDITELAQRIQTMEDTKVLKLIHDLSTVDNADADTDVRIVIESE